MSDEDDPAELSPAAIELAAVFSGSPLGPWASQAACVGAVGNLFDPPTADSDPLAELARTSEAARLCKPCPVRQECLADALTNRSVGVWGGFLFSGRGRRIDLVARLNDPAAVQRAHRNASDSRRKNRRKAA